MVSSAGCGTGISKAALAQLLAHGITIYTIDLEKRASNRIREHFDKVLVHEMQADLQSSSLRFPWVDGIPMVNALHFITRRYPFLIRLLSTTELVR
jgi:SAM-dependent methyltransferase